MYIMYIMNHMNQLKRCHMPRRNTTMEKLPSEHIRNHKQPVGAKHMVEDMEDLLTVREVARRLRVDDTTVRRWIKNGSLEAITLPHRGKRQAYRVKKSTMEKLMHSQHLPE